MSSGALYILASVTCFSLVNLLVKWLSHLPFEQLVFWRGLLCLWFSYLILKAKKIPVWGNNKKMLIFRGVAGTFALCFYFYSLQNMPLASAVTIQYLAPIFTVVIAGTFFGEKVEARHWLSALVGFAGVWVIQGFDNRVSAFDATMGVMGAISSALAYNSVRNLKDTDNEWVVIFYFPLIASIVTAPFAIRSWVWPTGWDWAGILALGLLVQIAQLFLTRGFSRDKASRVASVNYVGVVLAVIYGFLFFDESLSLAMVTGIGLILVSVGLSARRKIKRVQESRG